MHYINVLLTYLLNQSINNWFIKQLTDRNRWVSYTKHEMVCES